MIFNPSITEDKIDSMLGKFEKKVKESGGTDVNIAKWGMRRLASSIKKAKNSQEGFYIMMTFNGEGKTPNELKSLLNVSEEVIRYSIIASSPAAKEAKETKEERVEIEPSMMIQSPAQPGSAGEP
jgi:ribosomal protein S6